MGKHMKPFDFDKKPMTSLVKFFGDTFLFKIPFSFKNVRLSNITFTAKTGEGERERGREKEREREREREKDRERDREREREQLKLSQGTSKRHLY
jgi:hypothetical protein